MIRIFFAGCLGPAGLPDRDLDCRGVAPEPRKELRRPPALAEDGVAFRRVTSLFSGGVKAGGVKTAALTFLGGAGVFMSSAIPSNLVLPATIFPVFEI